MKNRSMLFSSFITLGLAFFMALPASATDAADSKKQIIFTVTKCAQQSHDVMAYSPYKFDRVEDKDGRMILTFDGAKQTPFLEFYDEDTKRDFLANFSEQKFSTFYSSSLKGGFLEIKKNGGFYRAFIEPKN